jgi:hypothetical protein
MIYLPARPETTTFLSDGAERDLAIERMNRDAKAGMGGTVNKSKFKTNIGYSAVNFHFQDISVLLLKIGRFILQGLFASGLTALLQRPPRFCQLS